MSIENSKLAELLGTLNESELKSFENYLLSPYFNNSEQIIKLFEFIKKAHPTFANINKEAIFRAIYPKEEYKDKKIRDLLSRMLGLAEDFLAQERFNSNKLLGIRLTLQELAAKNLEKHFVAKAKEADTEINKEKITSAGFLYDKYSIFKEKRNYLTLINDSIKSPDYYKDIAAEIELFEFYTLYKILRYGISVFINQKTIKHDYDFRILELILKYLKDNPQFQQPIIMIFYYLIILNRGEGGQETYLDLRKLIDENIHSINHEDQVLILVEQFNYTKIQSLKGDEFYKKENYRILKQNTDMKIYPKEGVYFTDSSYIMIAATAFIENDFEWAEKFMNDYKEKLDPVKRDNIYMYTLSVMHYRKKNYGEALKGFAKVSIDDFYYQIRVKNHQLKIYVETGDYESAERTVDTFKHFLGTVKYMPDYIKIRLVNYVNFVSRIVNAHLSGRLQNLIDIRSEISSFESENLENKLWLLEQINNTKI